MFYLQQVHFFFSENIFSVSALKNFSSRETNMSTKPIQAFFISNTFIKQHQAEIGKKAGKI